MPCSIGSPLYIVERLAVGSILQVLVSLGLARLDEVYLKRKEDIQQAKTKVMHSEFRVHQLERSIKSNLRKAESQPIQHV